MCLDLHGTVFCAFFQPCLLVCTTKQDASDGQNKPLDFQVIRSVRSPVQILKYKTNLCSCAQPTSSLLVQGSFFNYVDQTLIIDDHLPSTYPLLKLANGKGIPFLFQRKIFIALTFPVLSVIYLPRLVNVVKERPLAVALLACL